MTIVYFIRHAKSDNSVRDTVIRPLLPEGLEKLIELEKIFLKIKIDYVYSSPYKRSIQTIEKIVNNKNINIINDFREGKMNNNWIENFNEFIKTHWNDFSYKLKNAESLFEVQKRNIKALDNILLENKGSTIIIGTHGLALSSIINYYDKDFQYKNYLEIADIMPYIVKMNFNNNEYLGREEIKIL